MKKTHNVPLSLAIALAISFVLTAGCASAPDPASLPQSHDGFIAAGWMEVSARQKGGIVGERWVISRIVGMKLEDLTLTESGLPVLQP